MDFLINDLNIPTLQYGPGDSGLCHTDEERLSIAQLLDATCVYVRVALEAASDVKRDVGKGGGKYLDLLQAL